MKGVVEMVTPGHLDLMIEVRFEGITFALLSFLDMEFTPYRSLSDVDTIKRLDTVILRHSRNTGKYENDFSITSAA